MEEVAGSCLSADGMDCIVENQKLKLTGSMSARPCLDKILVVRSFQLSPVIL